MENHGDPRDREGESGTEYEEYEFLQETLKDEKKRGRIRKSTIIKCAVLGLVFGMTASLGFFALKPWAEDLILGDPDEITIPEEEEDQENTDTTEEDQSLVVSMDHYREMNAALTEIADKAKCSMARISVIADGTVDAENATGEEAAGTNSVTGVIVADNGQEYLIFGSNRVCQNGETVEVTFADGRSYESNVKQTDGTLGYAVYAVHKSSLAASTAEKIQVAALGRTGTAEQGNTIIAMGDPFGYGDSIGFGVIASSGTEKNRTDGEYRVIGTDISGAADGTGALFNVNGEVVGMIDASAGEEDTTTVTAYGISDLKPVIECLSNGESVPYLGITGVTVTEEIANEQEIPGGVYVQNVEADSPAMAAGIQSGDVITEIDKADVTTLSAYHAALMKQKTGDSIRIKGMRKGTDGYVDVQYNVTVGSFR